jgi:hypothetical protein
MRDRLLIATICCLVFGCSKEAGKTASPCDAPPLAGLIAEYPVHVLFGAADFVAGASAIADSTFGEVWQIDPPDYLAEHREPARIAAGIARVCAILDEMSPDTRTEAVNGIASWVDTYLAIRQGDNVSAEFFASAVAQTPEVRGAIPQDVIDRSPDGRVGDTMASAQFVAMDHALTHILARMPASERSRLLEEIRTRAAGMLDREADMLEREE